MKVAVVQGLLCNRPKNCVSANKKNSLSAPKLQGADNFCFMGKTNVAQSACIVPSQTPTSLETNIEEKTDVQQVDAVVKKFKNGETYVNIAGNVRGKDVYLMPSSGVNVNDNLMETYLKADAAKRAGANRVIAIMPNFDYARQEKRTEKGEPIAARLNMDLLETSGVDEIITTDLHTPALEGFASNQIRITHLESMQLMANYIKSKEIPDLVVVSPDLGGTKRADKLAKALDSDKAIVYKTRKAHNVATAEDLIGDVEGKNCVLIDDIIDTAGTIAEASKLLKKKGAKDIYVCAVHGLFNGEAMHKLNEAPIKEVIVTNSVPKRQGAIDKIKQVDLSDQIIGAMKEISPDISTNNASKAQKNGQVLALSV